MEGSRTDLVILRAKGTTSAKSGFFHKQRETGKKDFSYCVKSSNTLEPTVVTMTLPLNKSATHQISVDIALISMLESAFGDAQWEHSPAASALFFQTTRKS